MKKKLLITLLASIVLFGSRVKANDFAYQYPGKIRATCYTAKEGSITASGEHVRKGIIAGKREWMGKVAVLYDMELNLIGYYEFLDTGGHPALKDGSRIDIFMESDEELKNWISTYGDYVVMQIIEDAEG